MKLKLISKKLTYILIFVIIIYTFIGILCNKSYCATYTYTANSNDLPSNFDSLYPGYRTLINTLVSEHPNWTFKLLETNLDWNTVLNCESGHGKNLVQPGYYTSDWGCSCNVAYDGPWKCASRASIEYMMDPRNFLNSYDIFQFQDLASANGDASAVRSMITGTFMDTDTYREECVKGILDAAQQYSISPYFIVSKIIQEQSAGGSTLSAGQGYDINADGVNEYIGYYNLFNIGAYETSDAGQIENGLKKAQKEEWNSMYKSILSGAQFIKNDYMSVGQTTPYFQKYNVVNKDSLYSHQYMTNIWGAYSEGRIMRSQYIKYGIYDNSFTFTIPLYVGMPAMKGELARINVDTSLQLRNAKNGERLLGLNGNTVVLVIDKDSSKEGGYYWDKVITPYGTGYMARMSADESQYFLETMPLIVPTENVIDTSTNNTFTEPDANNIITTEPNTTASKIKGKYSNAVIFDKNGAEITGDTLVGTGAKVKIDGVEKYIIVKLGDVSGDGYIDARDSLRILKYSVGQYNIENEFKKSADINNDEEIDARDSLRILKYSVGQYDINL